MEKQVGQYGYLLGMVCAAVAIVWRALIAISPGMPEAVLGHRLIYTTFYKAALLFLWLGIAAASSAWLRQRQ